MAIFHETNITTKSNNQHYFCLSSNLFESIFVDTWIIDNILCALKSFVDSSVDVTHVISLRWVRCSWSRLIPWICINLCRRLSLMESLWLIWLPVRFVSRTDKTNRALWFLNLLLIWGTCLGKIIWLLRQLLFILFQYTLRLRLLDLCKLLLSNNSGLLLGNERSWW